MEQDSSLEGVHFIFEGLGIGGLRGKKYPRQRYHKWLKPIIVKNTEEDEAAQARGYGDPESPITANKYPQNWRHDLEEMSARQLALYAKDEFEVDLPHEAGREHLFKIIYRLYMNSPKSRDRIIFFAQTMELDYDWVMDSIKEKGEQFAQPDTEWEKEEVWL